MVVGGWQVEDAPQVATSRWPVLLALELREQGKGSDRSWAGVSVQVDGNDAGHTADLGAGGANSFSTTDLVFAYICLTSSKNGSTCCSDCSCRSVPYAACKQ